MKAKRIVIVLAGVILIAVIGLAIIFSSGNDRFRHDATKWAQPTIDQTNMITNNQLGTLSGKTLLVDLSEQGNLLKDNQGAIHIPASAILEKENQKKIRAHEGNIVLVTNDRALTARIWMLLSQMGYRNLYMLDEDAGNEILKYKFQPDTMGRLEL